MDENTTGTLLKEAWTQAQGKRRHSHSSVGSPQKDGDPDPVHPSSTFLASATACKRGRGSHHGSRCGTRPTSPQSMEGDATLRKATKPAPVNSAAHSKLPVTKVTGSTS